MRRRGGQGYETTSGEGHKNWHWREDSKHQYGVVFVVRKEVVGSFIRCTTTFSRLFSILISARSHNITVTEAYAPTSGHDDEGVEQFYAQFDMIIIIIMIMIMIIMIIMRFL